MKLLLLVHILHHVHLWLLLLNLIELWKNCSLNLLLWYLLLILQHMQVLKILLKLIAWVILNLWLWLHIRSKTWLCLIDWKIIISLLILLLYLRCDDIIFIFWLTHMRRIITCLAYNWFWFHNRELAIALFSLIRNCFCLFLLVVSNIHLYMFL